MFIVMESVKFREEAKLIALIIAAIRYGIDRNSLIDYLVKDLQLAQPVERDKCFLRALELNESIDAQYGKVIIPIGLITELVRIEYASLQEADSSILTGSVIRCRTGQGSNELTIGTLGEVVSILEDTEDWYCVSREGTDETGWVPKACIQLLNSIEI